MGLLDMAGGAFIGISLVLMSVITRGKIGLGDGLMLTVTGLLLGFTDNLKILTMSVLLTAGFSVILMIFGKCRKDTELPFAPFLLGAFLVTV
ncbi:leader peptidase (prepilin peptidase) / N-methyltransferase [Lachnospiraceae bacterium]|nr:leader peptidase (prepilin peptidase) / N-methyltransferase [Lachnospiraceae bacterium]